ncbi:MAG: riboflavin biosynthesis protein RibF, partial [Rhodospirillales bacterium]
MRIFRHFEALPAEARGAVAAIGNFDGVHRGHQAVIAEAGHIARAAAVPLAVLTFEPH